jgi:glycosyltransferase involved in cell wall biosynthesis
MPPIVSIIIPTHNRAQHVIEAVRSVLQQTYKDFEIIVVDDGSTDGTKEILAGFTERGEVRYVWQKNAGTAAARNAGIKLARGEYIAFLDSDDLFLPTNIEKQVAYMQQNPEVGLTHSYFSKFAESGIDLGTRNPDFFSGRIYPQLLLYWRLLTPPSSVVVRRKVFEEIGSFDESLLTSEDLDMWRRVARIYPFGIVRESLVKIRVHDGNKSEWNRKTAEDFAAYLQRAFTDDPSLGPVFRRRAWAKMYTNVAHNSLGEGTNEHMAVVRELAFQALRFWPFEAGAYLAIGASLLSQGLRRRLAARWRQLRYPGY